MRDLLGWIGRNIDHDISGSLADLPSVGFCASGDWDDYGSTTVLVDDALRGLHDWPNRRILLVMRWESSSPRNVAVLLHEFIHDVQLMGRSWECLQAPEWDAHELQEKWLSARGLDAGFNRLRICMLSRCPPDVHP